MNAPLIYGEIEVTQTMTPKKPAKLPAPLGTMRVERIPIKRIAAAKYNPRKNLQPADPEWQKIKRSIAEFGYVDTMVWNKRTGNLVGGHQRLKVLAAEFGVKAVDVSVVDLPLAKEKALNVALNRISGEWDTTALADLLSELQTEAEVDATVTGFDAKEIDVAIAEALAEQATADKEETPHDPRLTDQYGVLVTCNGEAQQKKAYKQITGLGYECKVLTI